MNNLDKEKCVFCWWFDDGYCKKRKITVEPNDHCKNYEYLAKVKREEGSE